MVLFSPVSARLGQFVRVTFQLDEGGQWLDVDALVVSQEAATQAFAWSLQFQAVPPHVVASIARYIEAGAAPPAPAAGTPGEARRSGGTQPLRRVPTGPHFPVGASAARGGTQPPMRRVPTGPQFPVGASPARSGETEPLPPMRRVPTGPQFPAVPPTASTGTRPPLKHAPTSPQFQFTSAPAPRSGTPLAATRAPTGSRFPVTASPAVLSSGRKAKPRLEVDDEDGGISDLYAQAVEAEEDAEMQEAAKREDLPKKK
jgi:hypothetical protein